MKAQNYVIMAAIVVLGTTIGTAYAVTTFTEDVVIQDGSGNGHLFVGSGEAPNVTISGKGALGEQATFRLISNQHQAVSEIRAVGGHALVFLADGDDATNGNPFYRMRLTDNTGRLDFSYDSSLEPQSIRMSIVKGGNIGIATTNPQELLDVNGNIRLTGNIVSPNDICIGNCP